MKCIKDSKFLIFYSIVVTMLLVGFQSCKESKATIKEAEVNKTLEAGFKAIFDGKTLNNWKGDLDYWEVENGCLVGTVTPENVLKSNTFIIWHGAQPESFELKLAYRISESGNSGINYRSEILENKPFALRGYQCDIDGKNKYTGQNYEEKKRTTLAYPGEQVVIPSQTNPDSLGNLRSHIKKNCWQSRTIVGSFGSRDSIKKNIKNNDWNTVHLVVNGDKLLHYINGVLISEVVDKDALNKSVKGYIGLQVHVGPPMKVEYRDIRLKNL